jgi:hypothetical protein
MMPTFIKQARARLMIKAMQGGRYFSSIEQTINDIVSWEKVEANSTEEELAKYDDLYSPSVVCKMLRLVAVTETMIKFDMTATAAGVILDQKLVEVYEAAQQHDNAYAKVRALLDSCGPKDE